MRRRDFITLVGGAAAALPVATRAQAARPVRFVERINRTRGGITPGRANNVTERWIGQFFQNPGQDVEDRLGINSSCLQNDSCLILADELLKERRKKWSRSPERGKILVCLTYVLGESLLIDRSELDWVVVLEAGTAFVDDIGIGSGNEMIGVFSRLANIDAFILDEGFDLATWKRYLLPQDLSKIDQEPSTLGIIIMKRN